MENLEDCEFIDDESNNEDDNEVEYSNDEYWTQVWGGGNNNCRLFTLAKDRHIPNKGWRHKMRKPIFLRRQDRLRVTMRQSPQKSSKSSKLSKQAQKPKVGGMAGEFTKSKLESLQRGLHLWISQNDYQQTPAAENRPKRRGPTKLANTWALNGEYKITLPLTDQGQPIGVDSGTFVRWLGSFCKNGLLCSLMPAGWPSVLEHFKQDCWIEIEIGPCLCFANSTFTFQKRYLIDPAFVAPPDQKEWAMHQLEVLRRNRRTKLKKDHYKRGMEKEQVLANKLSMVDKVQWTEMVNYWFLDKTQAKAQGAPVERADVYRKVYSRKDGATITPHAQENMESTI
ncbi:hypothetical protein SO802_028498 [Lithocarpus litseifolius]|uniref:Uncharacterized protein n=1 Tax=Lithocarpus litseifolius TaxID=425828 RepID=A0AAW2BTL3_9ROSI